MPKSIVYCADCSLSLLEDEKTCPKCGGTETTTERPNGKPLMYHVGITRFTRICHKSGTFQT